MRLTVVYPADCQQSADKLSLRLRLFRNVDAAWVSTTPDDFLVDLADGAESEDPLVVLIDTEFIGNLKVAPRTLWGPLLSRIESGMASTIGLVLLDEVPLPPLLRKAKSAQGPNVIRALDQWIVDWLRLERNPPPSGSGLDRGMPEPLKELLLQKLVDQPGIAHLSSACLETQLRVARDAARLTWPHFEAVHLLHAPHQIEVLRESELSRIKAEGRNLWIISGHYGNLPELPDNASMLAVTASGGVEIPPDEIPATESDPVLRAAKLITQIPNIEGQPLPFSTFELEVLLPELFIRHWALAERLARKAGAFFRLNHRIAEAVWVFETLRQQAELQAHKTCIQDCENELYWLKAGGARKHHLLSATQTGFEF